MERIAEAVAIEYYKSTIDTLTAAAQNVSREIAVAVLDALRTLGGEREKG